MALGDINGDGILDGAVSGWYSSGNTEVVILTGNGDGSFTGRKTFHVDGIIQFIALGDMDGNGDLDVVAGGDEGLVVLLAATLENEAREVTFSSGSGGSSCIIATAASGTPLESELSVLRKFRDRHLINTLLGLSVADIYYRVSSEWHSGLTEQPLLARITLCSTRAAIVMCVNPIQAGLAAILFICISISIRRFNQKGGLHKQD